ncbi:MAG: CoA transferase [Candidatus Binatia bacterium]|nr:CoA transferase [Candidatus Binatia bacterium]
MAQPRHPPLHGFRILEWGGWDAAIAGRILAGLGADVCMVEPPEGHPLRRGAPKVMGGTLEESSSLHFFFAACGKTSAVLPPQRSEFSNWLAVTLNSVDAVITSRSTHFQAADERVLAELLSASDCRVWIRIDPYADETYSEHTTAPNSAAELVSSFNFLVRNIVSIWAAASCVVGLVNASITDYRESLHSSSILAELFSLFERKGQRSESYWDRGFKILPTQDGWIATTILGNWSALGHAIREAGGPHWLSAHELEDVSVRYDRAEEIFNALRAWCRHWKSNALTVWAQLRRIPFASLRHPTQACADPLLRQRRFFFEGPSVGPTARLWHPRVPLVLRGCTLPNLTCLPNSPSRKKPLWDTRSAWRNRCANNTMISPLRGIKVLDFTHAVAGPLATQLLRRYGADVTKINSPSRTRVSHPSKRTFEVLHKGKHDVTVNAETDVGRAQIVEFIRNADIVVDNFSVRVMDNWGLNYASLRTINSNVIQTRMSGFGLTGRYRHWVAYAPTLHAWAGLSWLCGRPKNGEWEEHLPIPYSDIVTGLFSFLGTAAAILHRERCGRGTLVDVSGYECLLFSLGPVVLWAANQHLWSDDYELSQLKSWP